MRGTRGTCSRQLFINQDDKLINSSVNKAETKRKHAGSEGTNTFALLRRNRYFPLDCYISSSLALKPPHVCHHYPPLAIVPVLEEYIEIFFLLFVKRKIGNIIVIHVPTKSRQKTNSSLHVRVSVADEGWQKVPLISGRTSRTFVNQRFGSRTCVPFCRDFYKAHEKDKKIKQNTGLFN